MLWAKHQEQQNECKPSLSWAAHSQAGETSRNTGSVTNHCVSGLWQLREANTSLFPWNWARGAENSFLDEIRDEEGGMF